MKQLTHLIAQDFGATSTELQNWGKLIVNSNINVFLSLSTTRHYGEELATAFETTEIFKVHLTGKHAQRNAWMTMSTRRKQKSQTNIDNRLWQHLARPRESHNRAGNPISDNHYNKGIDKDAKNTKHG